MGGICVRSVQKEDGGVISLVELDGVAENGSTRFGSNGLVGKRRHRKQKGEYVEEQYVINPLN